MTEPSSSHIAPRELASACSTSRHISAFARSGRAMSRLAKPATASSAWMRPRVSAASRAFSIAMAACWAKSPMAARPSPTPLAPWTEPSAPTSRSPYHSGTSVQPTSLRTPAIGPRGGSGQRRAAVRPDQRSVRPGWPPPVTARAVTRPSSSNAQQAAPLASIIVRACSATLVSTPARSWPASPATIWSRTEFARARSLARCSRTVRSAMPITGAAPSSSWISSGVNGTSAARWADTARLPAAVGSTAPAPTPPAPPAGPGYRAPSSTR